MSKAVEMLEGNEIADKRVASGFIYLSSVP